MAQWARLIVSVLLLVAALAGGASGAFATKTGHACAEMNMGDCPDGHGDNAATSAGCAQLACGPSQIALPQHPPFLSPIVTASTTAPTPCIDADRGCLSGSPDLRPPIV
jgi:hypothetical protein